MKLFSSQKTKTQFFKVCVPIGREMGKFFPTKWTFFCVQTEKFCNVIMVFKCECVRANTRSSNNVKLHFLCASGMPNRFVGMCSAYMYGKIWSFYGLYYFGTIKFEWNSVFTLWRGKYWFAYSKTFIHLGAIHLFDLRYWWWKRAKSHRAYQCELKNGTNIVCRHTHLQQRKKKNLFALLKNEKSSSIEAFRSFVHSFVCHVTTFVVLEYIINGTEVHVYLAVIHHVFPFSLSPFA